MSSGPHDTRNVPCLAGSLSKIASGLRPSSGRRFRLITTSRPTFPAPITTTGNPHQSRRPQVARVNPRNIGTQTTLATQPTSHALHVMDWNDPTMKPDSTHEPP